MAWWKLLLSKLWESFKNSKAYKSTIVETEKELDRELVKYLKKFPAPKTYKSVFGDSLICSIADDRGNVVITKDVSENFVVAGVEGDRVIFTNSKTIEFPPFPSGFSEIKSVSFLGVKKDGTPHVTTMSVNVIKKRNE